MEWLLRENARFRAEAIAARQARRERKRQSLQQPVTQPTPPVPQAVPQIAAAQPPKWGTRAAKEAEIERIRREIEARHVKE